MHRLSGWFIRNPVAANLLMALILVAGHDPLRDEGIAYADRLQAAGSPVELVNHEGMIHAFWSLGGAIREAARSMDRAAVFLRRELGLPDPVPPQ